MKTVRILFIADIFGKPGLDILTRMLPGFAKEKRADLIVANGENADNGRGLTVELANSLYDLGVGVITSGNHIWDKAPIRKEFKKFPNLLRPLNYPSGSGGRGSTVFSTKSGIEITVLNLQGRTFMTPIDCPFRVLERYLENKKVESPIVFVDFHAESTAEKQALAWHFDGRVSAIIGTHTHVQTADERIFEKGTGYITDAGMTGSFDSVIGMVPKVAIRRFLTQTPQPFQTASDNLHICGVVVEIDSESGKCISIERFSTP
ncbi:MAG: TIGR00282 family metallophosphoesterase [Calditrichaeota bacterium]|nr:TIGR00282 family metallophosphoesterase [Calditrichota bacterium]MBT7787835.1 TIGR00282 family metallophosphoesterase [Calditrichota bacterium]